MTLRREIQPHKRFRDADTLRKVLDEANDVSVILR
jgi:hypothetical protein